MKYLYYEKNVYCNYYIYPSQVYLVKSEAYSIYFVEEKATGFFFLMYHIEIMDNARYFPRAFYDAEIGHFQHLQYIWRQSNFRRMCLKKKKSIFEDIERKIKRIDIFVIENQYTSHFIQDRINVDELYT